MYLAYIVKVATVEQSSSTTNWAYIVKVKRLWALTKRNRGELNTNPTRLPARQSWTEFATNTDHEHNEQPSDTDTF